MAFTGCSIIIIIVCPFVERLSKPCWCLDHLWYITLALKQVLDLAACHFLILRFKYCISPVQKFYIYENQHVFIVHEERARYRTKEIIYFNIKLSQNTFVYLLDT